MMNPTTQNTSFIGMRGFAAAVGKGRNLDALIRAGWGFMCLPDRLQAHGQPFALDNGAWTAFQQGRQLDELAFYRAVDRVGERAEFVVLPDIVCGGRASLDLTLNALDRLADLPARKLIAVQDGFAADDIASFLSPTVGIFVGGSTQWKESTARMWGELAKLHDAYLHIGRVNSVRRLRICAFAGADSFDGSGVSRFSSELPRIDFYRRHADLFAPRVAA